MKKNFYSLILSLTFAVATNATCTVDNLMISEEDCIGPGGFFGQVFTTCQAGTWTTLEVNISAITGGGMAMVYVDQNSVADANSPTKMLVDNFTVMGVTTLNVDIEVEANQKWVWWVELTNGMTELCYQTSPTPFGESDDYVHSPRTDEPGDTGNSGSLVSRGIKASARAGQGPVFQVSIIDPPAPPAPLIPTMNEWGLLIFGLLIVNLGVYTLRRKEEIQLD